VELFNSTFDPVVRQISCDAGTTNTKPLYFIPDLGSAKVVILRVQEPFFSELKFLLKISHSSLD